MAAEKKSEYKFTGILTVTGLGASVNFVLVGSLSLPSLSIAVWYRERYRSKGCKDEPPVERSMYEFAFPDGTVLDFTAKKIDVSYGNKTFTMNNIGDGDAHDSCQWSLLRYMAGGWIVMATTTGPKYKWVEGKTKEKELAIVQAPSRMLLDPRLFTAHNPNKLFNNPRDEFDDDDFG